MKILFLGGKTWGIEALKILKNMQDRKTIDFEIVGAVTNVSDSETLPYSDNFIKNISELNLPIYVFSKNYQILDLVKEKSVDLIISVFYDKILSEDILKNLNKGAINLHMGDSEKYRGCYSTLHAIINEDTHAGVTLHYIDSGIDSGDIIKKVTWEINKSISGYELYFESLKIGIKMLEEELPNIISGNNSRRPQNNENVIYNKKIIPQKKFTSEDIIDKPRKFINSIRAHDFVGFDGVSIDLNGVIYSISRISPYKINTI
ncbi:MAG: hypothetical protein IJD16_09315 [Desulfovibrio sp.]|nr:hypothetical protein [Desulfovibrio sp.]